MKNYTLFFAATFFVLLFISPIASLNRNRLHNEEKDLQVFQTSNSNIRIVGPDRDPNPVVNEGRQIQLNLIGTDGQPVSDATFESGSPDVASVDPRTGMVTGVAQGFATITARRGSESVSNFIVVARVRSGKGAKVTGRTSVDTSGAIYLSDPINHLVFRRATPTASAEIFAGQNGSRGRTDGPRSRSQFAGPIGVAVDNRPQGGVYIADTLNHSIRRVSFNDQVVTVMGNGSPGINRDDVTPFNSAAFSSPQGIAMDTGGNLFIADTDNHAIYVADFDKREVRLVAGSPGNAGKADGRGRAALFNRPTAIIVRPVRPGFSTSQDMGILIADSGNNRIRLVSADGTVTTLGRIQSGFNGKTIETQQTSDDELVFNNPRAIGVDAFGSVYVTDQTGVRLITEPVGQNRQLVSLAQPGVSFGQAVSITVRGTTTFVLDANSVSEEDAVKAVTVGEPQIASFSQDSAQASGGDTVVITGKNFAPESRVLLGETEITDLVVESATRIRVVIPRQGRPGATNLSVQTRGGIAQRPFFIAPPSLSSISQGAITTIAGGADFVGDGGLSINATLFAPKGLAIDAAGRLLVADRANQRVRRVDINNASIITVAGTGAFGDSPDGLDALRTNFTLPSKVAVDSDGNIYTNDFINIRKIDAMTTKVETLVSSSSLSSFALDSRSNIFFVDIDCHCLRRFDAVTKQVRTIAGTGQMGFGGDGGNPATAQLSTPRDVFIDGADNIYIVDTGNNRIRRIEADLSRISTIVGNGQAGFSGDGGAATSASLREPQAVAVDPAGNIFVADSANNTIRFVNIQTGIIATIAGLGPGREGFSGDGGFARLAQLNRPEGLVVVGSGVIFVADTNNNCVRAIATREGENEPRISTLAGNSLTDFLGENIPAIRGRLFRPTGIAFNQTGALHIGEFESGRVRRIDPTSQIIQTVVGLNRGSGLGDGGSAQNAFLQSVQGIAFDRSGNLYIVDKFLARVRRVNIATGIIETFAGNGSTGFGGDGGSARQALLNEPSRIAFDNDGNAFISDTENHRIRRVDVRTGIITTVAGSGQNGFSGDGGLATSARLSAPEAIAIDLQGNLYIGDSDNRRVRRVDGRTGIITTIAGSEQLAMGGLDGDGGLAINAALSNSIADIKFDTGGNLYFTDTFLGRVRKVDLSTGIISRVAGSGFTLSTDFADGASALQANLRAVAAIAFDSAGNLFISDNDNNALRVVKGVASTGGQPATVTITAATFNRPNFVLSGTGFGQTGARVEINGVDVSQRITSQNSQQITLKGNKKKLNLRNGANQIVVRVGTAVSNTFVFNFLSEESFFNTKWTKWSCRLPRR